MFVRFCVCGVCGVEGGRRACVGGTWSGDSCSDNCFFLQCIDNAVAVGLCDLERRHVEGVGTLCVGYE